MEGIRNIVRVRLQVPMSTFEWSTLCDWRFPSTKSITLHAEGALGVAGHPDRGCRATITSVAADVDSGVSGTMLISHGPRIENDDISIYMPNEQFRALLDCRLSARNFLAELLIVGGADTPPHPDDDYHVYDVKVLTIKLTEMTP